MKYLLTIVFTGFVLAQVYILHMNRKASIKRKAFRWWLVVCGVFLTVFLAVSVADKILLVLVLPVLAGVLFGFARFTKFCDWCGTMVKTNLPFTDKKKCRRCGSSVS
jgi:hypothetical protein